MPVRRDDRFARRIERVRYRLANWPHTLLAAHSGYYLKVVIVEVVIIELGQNQLQTKAKQ